MGKIMVTVELPQHQYDSLQRINASQGGTPSQLLSFFLAETDLTSIEPFIEIGEQRVTERFYLLTEDKKRLDSRAKITKQKNPKAGIGAIIRGVLEVAIRATAPGGGRTLISRKINPYS